VSHPHDQTQALVAEVEQARAQLAASVSSLRQEFTPAALGKRAIGSVSGFFTDSEGKVRTDRVAIAGAAVLAVVGVKVLFWRRVLTR